MIYEKKIIIESETNIFTVNHTVNPTVSSFRYMTYDFHPEHRINGSVQVHYIVNCVHSSIFFFASSLFVLSRRINCKTPILRLVISRPKFLKTLFKFISDILSIMLQT